MTFDEFNKKRGQYYESFSKELSEFEKNFLLLAGGVLTFTITFIKDIVGVGNYGYIALLFLGWISLGAAIGGIVYTFLKSAYASEDISDKIGLYLKDHRIQGKDNDKFPEEHLVGIKNIANNTVSEAKRNLKSCRVFSVFAFFIGLVFVGVFVGINFTHSRQTEKDVNSQSIEHHVVIEGIKLSSTDSTITLNLKAYGKKDPEKGGKKNTKKGQSSKESD